jgi:hypothetical protein
MVGSAAFMRRLLLRLLAWLLAWLELLPLLAVLCLMGSSLRLGGGRGQGSSSPSASLICAAAAGAVGAAWILGSDDVVGSRTEEEFRRLTEALGLNLETAAASLVAAGALPSSLSNEKRLAGADGAGAGGGLPGTVSSKSTS